MLDIDKIIELAESRPGSFTRTNMYALLFFAMTLKPYSRIVEIGIDQGRSSSLLLAAANEYGHHIDLIDSWASILVENKHRVEVLVSQFQHVNAEIHHKTSLVAAAVIPGQLHLIHIDAGHTEGNPAQDCQLWLPKLVDGGIACFHDYAATGMPEVQAAVDTYTDGWDHLGNWEGLAVRRKR